MRVDVTILGAGAAGLACAAACARRGRRVVVLDHGDKPGRKVLASGGGRCNCTNREVGATDYRCANPHFTKSVLARCSPDDLLRWLHAGGVATVEEAGGKIFCRDGSRAMARFLEADARQAGVRLHLGAVLHDARKDGPDFLVDTDAGTLRSQALILALGGKSWSSLGATGLGYTLAEGFGLAVTPLRPGLVPLTAGPDLAPWCRELTGISTPVRLAVGKETVSGDLLFTHHGISGPAVLDASLAFAPGQDILIDLVPGVDVDALLAAAERQDIHNALAKVLPKRLASALCERQALVGPVAQMPLKRRRELTTMLGAFPFRPAGTAGFAKAEVTLGGVATPAVSSKTLEVAALPGLYVIGELLDVTGRLGGFNLHWAFASGFAAGAVA